MAGRHYGVVDYPRRDAAGGAPGTVVTDEDDDDEDDDEKDGDSSEVDQSAALAASIAARAVAAVQRVRGLSLGQQPSARDGDSAAENSFRCRGFSDPAAYRSPSSASSEESGSESDEDNFASPPEGGHKTMFGGDAGAFGMGDEFYSRLGDGSDGDDGFGSAAPHVVPPTPPSPPPQAVVVGGAVAFAGGGAGHASLAAEQLGLGRRTAASPPMLTSIPVQPSSARPVRACVPSMPGKAHADMVESARREEEHRHDMQRRPRPGTPPAQAMLPGSANPRVATARDAAALAADVLQRARVRGDAAAKAFDESQTPSGLALVAAAAHQEAVAGAAQRRKGSSSAVSASTTEAAGVAVSASLYVAGPTSLHHAQPPAVGVGGSHKSGLTTAAELSGMSHGAQPSVPKKSAGTKVSTANRTAWVSGTVPRPGDDVGSEPNGDCAVAAARSSWSTIPSYAQRTRGGPGAQQPAGPRPAGPGGHGGGHGGSAPFARPRLKGGSSTAPDKASGGAPARRVWRGASEGRPVPRGPGSTVPPNARQRLAHGPASGFGRGASEGRAASTARGARQAGRGASALPLGLTSYRDLALALAGDGGAGCEARGGSRGGSSQSMPRPHPAHSAASAAIVARGSRSASRPQAPGDDGARVDRSRSRGRQDLRFNDAGDCHGAEETHPSPRSSSPGALFSGGVFRRGDDDEDDDNDDNGHDFEAEEEKIYPGTEDRRGGPTAPSTSSISSRAALGMTSYLELLTMSVDRGSMRQVPGLPGLPQRATASTTSARPRMAGCSASSTDAKAPGRWASMERQRLSLAALNAKATESKAAGGGGPRSVVVGGGLVVPISAGSSITAPPKTSAAATLRARAAAAAAAAAAATAAAVHLTKSKATKSRIPAPGAKKATPLGSAVSRAVSRATGASGETYASLVAKAEAGRLVTSLVTPAASSHKTPDAASQAVHRAKPATAAASEHISKHAASAGRNQCARRRALSGPSAVASDSNTADSPLSSGTADDPPASFSSYKSLRAAYAPEPAATARPPRDAASGAATGAASGAAAGSATGAGAAETTALRSALAGLLGPDACVAGGRREASGLFGNGHLLSGEPAVSKPLVVTVAVPNLLGAADRTDDRTAADHARRAEESGWAAAAREIEEAVAAAAAKATEAERAAEVKAAAAAAATEERLRQDAADVAGRRVRPTSPPRASLGSHSFLLGRAANPAQPRAGAAAANWHDAYAPSDQLLAAWRK